MEQQALVTHCLSLSGAADSGGTLPASIITSGGHYFPSSFWENELKVAEKFSPASVHTSPGIDSVQVWWTSCVSGGLVHPTAHLNTEWVLQLSQTAGVSVCGSIAARCFIASVSRFQRTASMVAWILKILILQILWNSNIVTMLVLPWIWEPCRLLSCFHVQWRLEETTYTRGSFHKVGNRAETEELK